MTENTPDPVPPGEHYDAIAAGYAADVSMMDVPDEIFERFMDMVPAESSRILDAGCGPGTHAAYFADHGYTVDGIDVSAKMLVQARADYADPEFQQADLRNLPFQDNVFDGVWCCSSIYMLSPDEMPQTFSELARVLDDDGALYVNFKIGDSHDVETEWGSTITKHRITQDEAETFLREAGFEIEHKQLDDDPDGFGAYFCRKAN